MKIIIITRDREYGDSLAYRKFSKVIRTNGKGVFNTYMHSLFERALTERNATLYGDLIGKSSLPSIEDIETDICNSGKDGGKIIYEQKIKGKLDEILSNCKPYASFKMDTGNEVTFVFVNEVFDKFFPSLYEDYPRFVKCENRRKFIESICRDCSIEKISPNDNILYIHDKEWGSDGEKYILVHGMYCHPKDEDSLRKENYDEYFSNLIVFQHTGLIFNQIKALKFEIAREVREEVRIKKEGYF